HGIHTRSRLPATAGTSNSVRPSARLQPMLMRVEGKVIVSGLLVALTAPQAPPLPRYERQLLLETTSETSANVSFGDVNGDGHLDIVLAKGRHWPLVDRVLLGDGR